jgi:hypothetical protein
MKLKNFILVFLLTLVVVGGGLYWIASSAEKREREEQFMKDVRLSSCVDNAYKTYSENWDSQCLVSGYGKGCLLPLSKKQILDDNYNKDMDRCVELYK